MTQWWLSRKTKSAIHSLCSPCTNENIFSTELCVARVTLNFSDSSTNFAPTTAWSNTLYIRLASQRPNLRSRPENTGLSVEFSDGSASTYSKHDAGVRSALRDSSAATAERSFRLKLLKCAPEPLLAPPVQSDTWSRRRVRKTLEMVKASTLIMLKFRNRHDVCVRKEKERWELWINYACIWAWWSSPEPFEVPFGWLSRVTSLFCQSILLSASIWGQFCRCLCGAVW